MRSTGSITQGMVRLDLNDNDSIKNASNIPLGGAGAGNGDFTAGDFYTVTNEEIDVTSPQDNLEIVNGSFPGNPPPANEAVTGTIDNTTTK